MRADTFDIKKRKIDKVSLADPLGGLWQIRTVDLFRVKEAL